MGARTSAVRATKLPEPYDSPLTAIANERRTVPAISRPTPSHGGTARAWHSMAHEQTPESWRTRPHVQ
jgi:hypothetical protein